MLELVNIKKSYKTKYFQQNALNDVSIAFRKNEFTSILGASGSGKTTMLNIIGGLDQYDEGDLLIDNISTKNYKSSDWDSYRNNRVGFIFQSYNLIVHQSVLANVELALTLSGVSKKERREKAKAALKEVGLIDHIHKLPTQLSGGQMQRVAIARALINDPEIVLADEPTGALDEKTSDQVMELLSKIAKDRLVIMVTHNPKLAKEYTNRIIELSDGKVIGDSNPYTINEQKTKVDNIKKTSMSFLTAISLSVSNLMTKKVRTLITAIAGSIGIIGIAAILALASGINLYIKDIEQETMSSYPLTIDSSGIDISSFMGAGVDFRDSFSSDISDDELPVLNSLDSMFAHQSQNDLKSLKAYIENDRNLIDPYVKNIQYKYGITPEIFLPNENSSVWQVNPDKLFSKFGIGEVGGLSMIAGGSEMGMKSFNELPGDISLLYDQYDVVAGRWPSESNEAVVVLMDSGALTDFNMYALGLKDRSILKQQFENLVDNKDSDFNSESLNNIKYDEILNVKFKVIDSAAKYTYDSTYEIWVDKSEDSKHMEKIIDEALDLNIVGILKASIDSNAATLTSGIYYSQDLSKQLINKASEYDIVKAQLENDEINVFTNKSFSEENQMSEDLFNFSDLISIDESKIQNAFNFDTSAFNLDMSNINIDMSNVTLPEINIEDLINVLSSQINIPTEQLSSLLSKYIEEFIKSQEDLGVDNLEEWLLNLNDYLNDSENLNEFLNDFNIIIDDSKISESINNTINNYLANYMNNAFSNIMLGFQNQFQREIEKQFSNIQNAFSIDQNAFMSAFEFNLGEDEIFDLIRSMSVERSSNQISNLKLFGYRDLDDPTQINLYPKDFSTKDSVIEYLTTYNNKMSEIKQDEKIITYTDFIGALMSSVTTIINTISYALIAFVAISLVVSSIMIGVIIYVSVLERIKEIGILRSIGASKKDIRRVFNAEAIIIGFIAGVLGIMITFVISKIANIIVYNVFDIRNIARLEYKAALILILISVLLAFISGLIPSGSAAKKDPVDALRSE